MNFDYNTINNLIQRETLRVIRETLDSHLGDDSDERRRQKNQAAVIQKRNLRAGDDAEDVDEAEEEVEEETEEETEETGVPSPEDAKPREDRTGGKGTADSPKLATPTDAQIEKASPKSVIDKLNVLRGGRSLKDPEVKKSFTQYFNGLTHTERESLLVFLTGLAQVLAGVSSGGEAIDPGDVGLRVKGDVESTPKARDQKVKREKEGTKDAPIVVGESQNKYLVKKMFEAYKRYE